MESERAEDSGEQREKWERMTSEGRAGLNGKGNRRANKIERLLFQKILPAKKKEGSCSEISPFIGNF